MFKIAFALFTMVVFLSACGIFKKGCNCPKFYKPYQTQHTFEVNKNIAN
jgi:hypothetical protein